VPKIYFPLKPYSMRKQLEDGDMVEVRDVRRLLILHQRAAKATPLLLGDGWGVWFTGFGLEADHPDLVTREKMKERLAVLGIPVKWVMF